MCGRYKLSTPGDELWESFDLHGEQLPLVPRFNIAPTQPIAVIREPQELELLRWVLTLPNPRVDGFNVRVESLNALFYRDSSPVDVASSWRTVFTSGRSSETPTPRSCSSSRT